MSDAVAAAPAAADTSSPGDAAPAGNPGGALPGKPAVKPNPKLSAAKKPDWLADDGIELDVPGGKKRVSWEQARAQLQKGAHGDRVLFEASEARKEAQRLKAEADAALADLKDPAKVLKRLAALGHDVRKLTAGHVISEVEREEMTPAEREALELREKLAAIDAEKKAAEDAKAKEAQAEQAKAAVEEYKQKWAKMAEELGLKPGPHMAQFFQRIAGLEARNIVAGINAPAEVLLDAVRADGWALTGSLLEASSDAELIERLGEATVKRIAKAYLAAKQPKAQAEPQDAAPLVAPTPRPRAANGQFAEPSTRERALFARL